MQMNKSGKVHPLLFKQLIFIFLPAKLCLVLPFQFNVKTGRAFKSTIGACLNLSIGAAYYGFHLNSAYYQMISQVDLNFVSKIIDSYNQYAGCSILMVIIVNSCYYQGNMVEITEILNEVDDFLGVVTKDFKWPTQFMWKFHGPAYLFVIGLCFMEYYYCIMFIKDKPTYSTLCLLMCYAPLLVHVTTELVFCAFLLCITDRLSLMQKVDPLTLSIRESKRAFDALKRAKNLLNASFEIPLLLLIFHQFTAIVTLTYDLTVAIVKYDFNTPGYNIDKIVLQLQSSGGWSLFFIAETFVLCWTSEQFVREFHRTGSALLKELTERSKFNEEGPSLRWTQLQIVAQTRDGFTISACGLFQVNMQLLFNMIGIITTYLIILVQFDVAQRESQHANASILP